MEFFQGRGRFSEDDEVVDMIGDMDKVPYSSSSSSNGRWGTQFYDKSQKTELKRAESDGGSGGSGGGVGGGGGGGEEEVVYIEREHMFDKVVTPSDVGKLNRLVIPKQHAEKYFPLDSTANEKGLLLNFEDRGGKPWRFRYSYWNSSQSYVMTKGWSRFVKEKKLYAGDVVSFQRGAGESVKDRLYIDWRRRSDVHDPSALPPLPILHPLSFPRTSPWGGLILPPSMPMPMSMPRGNMVWQPMNYGHIHNPNLVNSNSSPIFYLRSSSSHPIGVVQQVREADQVVFNSVPVVHGKASAKRLRLFGVNLDCPAPENTEYQFLDPVEVTHQSQFPPSIPPLQLRLYNDEPPQSESPKESQSMSLDLDI